MMADIEDPTSTEQHGGDEPDPAEEDMEQQNDSTLLDDNDDTKDESSAQALDQESEEAALLAQDEHNESSIVGDNDGAAETSEQDKDATAKDNAAAEDEAKMEEGEDVDDEEEEKAKRRDSNEMPQVDVATLSKRKWQIKVYPLKPQDFLSGQISRVFTNARESLLYIHSSGRFSGGKGEMYVSSEVQAARVVHNLMKLDFKSPNINIEIIRKNDEGGVEEKAFLRFDAKLVRILCVPTVQTRRMGSKREQIIGSVFVKNLPKTTSKDILRVMFPFAPEINYNPDKFHDSTARLVLSTRNAVVPCLKAFDKVEIGDTKLELRPLQRKNDKTGHEKSDSEKSKEEANKSESESKNLEPKQEEKDKETSKSATDKHESGSQAESKQRSAKGPSANKSADAKKGDDHKSTGKSHSSATDSRSRRGQNQGGIRDRRNIRDRRGGLQNTRNRFRGGLGDRNRFRSAGGFDRHRSNERRAGLAGATGGAAINTEAAKEMILLQSQLSMAIKNQLSMLSQTQIALEQAKRGATATSLSRDVVSSPGRASDHYNLSPRRGRGKSTGGRRQQYGRARDRRTEEQLALVPDYGYKRSADIAGLSLDYGAAGLGKRRHSGLGEGPSWAEERRAAALGHQAAFGYEPGLDDREREFGRLQAGLDYNYGYRY